jgi:hypothetical protein
VYPLRELVHRATLHSDYTTTFDSLLSKLTKLHIGVTKEDTDSGEIVARCLIGVNGFLWRCWNDPLVFEVKRLDAAKTQVTIYAVPNLLRFGANRSEEPIELKKLVSQLFI